MPPNQQPVPYVQPQPQPTPAVPQPSYNFVPDPNAPAPQPQQVPAPAPAPQPDPAIASLTADVQAIKDALTTPPDPNAQLPAPAPVAEPKKYGDWGEVFADVNQLVEQKFEEQNQAFQQTNDAVRVQEAQNQQQIDQNMTQLRGAGYLPPIVNQYDPNDAGKIAENELIGYAVYQLGTTDLGKAAQELQTHHVRGEVYDFNNKKFVQTNQPSNQPGDSMFGSLPPSPDQPMPQAGPVPPAPGFAPPVPGYPQPPVGPVNPYAPPQYPAGFNAPVSTGGTFTGTQGQAPTLTNLRHNSYDALVEQFSRTQ